MMLTSSLQTVRARITLPTKDLFVQLPFNHRLAIGDVVYLSGPHGLERIGEVTALSEKHQTARLAIQPNAYDHLDNTTEAVYWQTPLSAESALASLLPKEIQKRASQQLTRDWIAKQKELAEVWRPLIRDLSLAYLEILTEELGRSLQNNEDEFRKIVHHHTRQLAAARPTIQARINPILQEHLTPVLAKRMNDALADAPKLKIAWAVGRSRHEDALRIMLNWLTDYLADMPDDEQEEVRQALERTWEEIHSDPVLLAELGVFRDGVVEDQSLRDLLLVVYREALLDNPRTAEFLRTSITDSPRVREQIYNLIEQFAPTSRAIAKICLFNDQGATRPEIVHLLRSVTLDRKIAWLTLNVSRETNEPLPPDATLVAISGESTP